jgi:hypothetical protein
MQFRPATRRESGTKDESDDQDWHHQCPRTWDKPQGRAQENHDPGGSGTPIDPKRPGQNQCRSAPEARKPENQRTRFIEAEKELGKTLQSQTTSHECCEDTIEPSLKQSHSHPQLWGAGTYHDRDGVTEAQGRPYPPSG